LRNVDFEIRQKVEIRFLGIPIRGFQSGFEEVSRGRRAKPISGFPVQDISGHRNQLKSKFQNVTEFSNKTFSII
jgi:hypothetical protein